MVMYPTVTMPESDFQQHLPSVSEVLATSMASGSVIVSDSNVENYVVSSSDDLMDMSSAGYTSTTQHAIPTSVITPTTSLANGWGIDPSNANLHGGFVPPPVSSTVYAIPTSAIRSVPQNQQRLRVSREDLDLLRMSPSNNRRRIRDEELAPEERLKRKQRRERNKLAAAKCRQRRVDHTNALILETEEWEAKNTTLEQELAKLQQQKEQLEFILEAHRAMCKKSKASNKEPSTTATGQTTTATTKVMTLDTPSTEVVTPTAFKQEPFGAGDSTPTGNGLSSPSCGREAGKRPGNGTVDLSSSGVNNRTMMEL